MDHQAALHHHIEPLVEFHGLNFQLNLFHLFFGQQSLVSKPGPLSQALTGRGLVAGVVHLGEVELLFLFQVLQASQVTLLPAFQTGDGSFVRRAGVLLQAEQFPEETHLVTCEVVTLVK